MAQRFGKIVPLGAAFPMLGFQKMPKQLNRLRTNEDFIFGEELSSKTASAHTGRDCFAGGIHHRFDVSGSRLSVRDEVLSGWFNFDIPDPREEPRELRKEEIKVEQLRFWLTYPILIQMWRSSVEVTCSIDNENIVLKRFDLVNIIPYEILGEIGCPWASPPLTFSQGTWPDQYRWLPLNYF
jgi:hypothetical protein